MTETKKLYYSISEVSKRLGVKPHVLRYWETQFRWLRPKKNRAGNRSYQEKDLDLLEQIREELLYDRRFTIEGARKEIDQRRTAGNAGAGGTEVAGDSPVLNAAPGPGRGPVAGHPTPSGKGRGADAQSSSPGSPPADHPAGTATGVSPDPRVLAARERSENRLREVRSDLRGLKEWLEGRS